MARRPTANGKAPRGIRLCVIAVYIITVVSSGSGMTAARQHHYSGSGRGNGTSVTIALQRRVLTDRLLLNLERTKQSASLAAQAALTAQREREEGRQGGSEGDDSGQQQQRRQAHFVTAPHTRLLTSLLSTWRGLFGWLSSSGDSVETDADGREGVGESEGVGMGAEGVESRSNRYATYYRVGSGRGKIDIHNFFDLQYYGPVTDSDGQNFQVTFDTGSSFTWLPGSGCKSCDHIESSASADGDPSITDKGTCQDCAGPHRLRYCGKSLDRSLLLTYGKGSAYGVLCERDFTLGGLTVHGQPYVYVTETDTAMSYLSQAEGIVGMGFSTLSENIQTVMESLVAEDVLSVPQFTFVLTENGRHGSQLILGDTPWDEDFIYSAPVVQPSYWTVQFTSVSVLPPIPSSHDSSFTTVEPSSAPDGGYGYGVSNTDPVIATSRRLGDRDGAGDGGGDVNVTDEAGKVLPISSLGIIDTGSSLIYTPDDPTTYILLLKELQPDLKELKRAQCSHVDPDSPSVGVVQCLCNHVHKWKRLSWDVGNVHFDIGPAEYFIPGLSENPFMCTFAIQPGSGLDGNAWLIGDAFLKKWAATFRLAPKPTVGFSGVYRGGPCSRAEYVGKGPCTGAPPLFPEPFDPMAGDDDHWLQRWSIVWGGVGVVLFGVVVTWFGWTPSCPKRRKTTAEHTEEELASSHEDQQRQARVMRLCEAANQAANHGRDHEPPSGSSNSHRPSPRSSQKGGRLFAMLRSLRTSSSLDEEEGQSGRREG